MSKLGRQRFRWSLSVRKLTDGLDGLQGLGPEVIVQGHLDPALAADVVEDSSRYCHAQFFFEQQALSADLDGVIVPVRGQAVSAWWATAALVFNWPNYSILFLN